MRAWDALLSSVLRRVIRKGELRLLHSDGRVESFGEAAGRPAATVWLHDRSLPRALVLSPSLGLGEAYADGRLTVDGDDLCGLLELLLVNGCRRRDGWSGALWRAGTRVGRRLSQFNPPSRARRNASHHYNLPPALYELFLDADLQYSSAYFSNPRLTLDEAQAAKKDVIAAKLLLRPGHRVLDIGSGWGGLALHLAASSGVHVTGVTLSDEQHRISSLRADSSKLPNKPSFRLQDYRHVTGMFDRVVSVGMFEHVGSPHYDEFFRAVRERLADDGVALIHTIGRAHGPAPTDPWIARYIFPGAAIPALSEIMPTIERSGLILTDVDVWRLHYAETLKAWRERFCANRDRISEVCGERFCRMWAYYLAVSEMAFRHGDLVVFQLQLARRMDAVPLTRDYLMNRLGEAEPVAEAG
jgi:cyclopropane-fatty-acyl-phospholipid synthase